MKHCVIIGGSIYWIYDYITWYLKWTLNRSKLKYTYYIFIHMIPLYVMYITVIFVAISIGKYERILFYAIMFFLPK